MERAKKIITYALIAFALISIGFALGKHSARKTETVKEAHREQEKQIIVYYLHSTFRCSTCNTIEKMTSELLHQSYAEELASSRIKWRQEDFQENSALAATFEVVASCVVVARLDKGEICDYQRLDEVWTLLKDPPAFNSYISKAIDRYLDEDEK